jgi:predicted amidohydrolase YtcJ
VARTGVINCDVITLDEGERAEALIIEDGKIVLVSDSEKAVISKLRTGDALLDLEGRCAIPGFIDSHTHISTVGMMEIGVDLSGAMSKDEVKRKVREGARRIEHGGWLYARGWDESHWNGDYVTKEDLDDASKDRNVVAVRVCGHLATVNSSTLANIKGALERHRGFYDLRTGILKEDAVAEATRSVYRSEGTVKSALAAGQKKALTLGVTSVHDVVDARRIMAYYELSGEGNLKIRTCMMIEWDDAQDMMKHGLKTGYGNEWLRIGGAKMYADGSIGARTAALSEPYTDEPGSCGSLLLSPKKMNSMVGYFADGGFQVCAHAIGDLAVSSLVGSLSKVKALKGHPHRVEHAEMISDEGIAIARERGIALSMQPNFIGQWGQKGGMYEKRLGMKRTSIMNPFRKIIDAGVKLTFGSDCMPLDPLYGIRSAVDAPFACQRLKPIEALRAYTAAGAILSNEPKIKGRISRGMFADLAVLSHDPLKNLDKARVDATIVDGSIAWERIKVKKREV